eukprot:scaffold40909_cov73-Phaeocystis_antarctica.AAC.9
MQTTVIGGVSGTATVGQQQFQLSHVVLLYCNAHRRHRRCAAVAPPAISGEFWRKFGSDKETTFHVQLSGLAGGVGWGTSRTLGVPHAHAARSASRGCASSVGRTHVQPLVEAAVPLRREVARLLVARRRLLRARRARLLSRRGTEPLPPDVSRLAAVEVDGVHPRTERLTLTPHEDLGGGG